MGNAITKFMDWDDLQSQLELKQKLVVVTTALLLPSGSVGREFVNILQTKRIIVYMKPFIFIFESKPELTLTRYIICANVIAYK